MSARTWSRSVCSGAVVAAALSLAACGGDGEAGGAEAASPQDSYQRVVNVEVRPVRTTSFTERIRLTGTVEANQDVEVAAEESGRIVRILAEKGARVEAEQPLVRIDDSILRAQVEEARARARLSRELWERRERLWEQDRVGTEQAYLEARANAEQAAANLSMLEVRLARTTIRAPFEGILEDRMVERGQLVSPGTPVARVVELDTVKVTAGVPERFAGDVEPGSPATVSFDVFPGREFRGEISFVGSTVNPGNRTFPVEFTLPNPNGAVKPQMVANVSVVRRTLEGAVVIPQEALVRTEGGFRAFVVEEGVEGPVVRARDVSLGPAQRNRVVVEEGLAQGERLIVVGQQQVAEGDRVRIVESAAPGSGAVELPDGADPEEPAIDPDEPEAWDSAGDSEAGARR